MTLTTKAQTIHTQLEEGKANLGDLRKIAKDTKKDHALAKELWSSKTFMARMLSILIMDVKQLSDDDINALFELFRFD